MSMMINNQFDPGYTVSILLVNIMPARFSDEAQRGVVCRLDRRESLEETWRKPIDPDEDVERWDGLS